RRPVTAIDQQGRVLRLGRGAGNPRRDGVEDRLAVSIVDAFDQVGLYLVAAVGEGGPASGDFQGREAGGTKCQGQVSWQILRLEAEAFDVAQAAVDSHVLEQANGNQVTRLVQRFAYADRPEEGVVVVLRPPLLRQVVVGEDDRGVVDQGGGGVAIVQRSAVDEGLEAGAGLAFRLNGAVVVALVEGETADERLDGATVRVEGDQGALRGGDLDEAQAVVSLALDAHDIADLDDIPRLLRARAQAVGIEEGPSPLHGVPGNGLLLRVAGQHQD